jgi:uncharacterized membrane protein
MLAGVIALGVLVRFPSLGQQSYWYDETMTWKIVGQGFGHVLATVPKTESTPPLYYMLLWLWSRIFGLSEWGLRSFSAVCGVLTIPVVWAIGRRLFSERVGLIAALLTAVNPLLFWYAQETRTYAFLTLLSALTLWALLYALARPSRSRLLLWGVISALALCAHYFAAVVVAPEAIWLLVELRRRGLLDWARVAIALGPPAAMAVALAPLLIHQNDGRASYVSNLSGGLPYRLTQVVKQDIIGDGQPAKIVLGTIGFAFVLVAGALLVRRGTRQERTAALLPVAVGVGGMVLALIAAGLGKDYFDSRNLLPTWPALVVVVAAGLGCARAGRTGLLATIGLTALSVLCVSNIIRDPNFQRDNWRGAVQALGPATEPRAIVADINSVVTLRPYVANFTRYPVAAQPVREVDLVWVGRHGYGSPLVPIKVPQLPGFSAHRVRTSSYLVVRYRASHPVVEPVTALIGLFPARGAGTVLLQRP